MKTLKHIIITTIAGTLLIVSCASFASGDSKKDDAKLMAKSNHDLLVALVKAQRETNEWLDLVMKRLQEDADIKSGKIIN